MIERLHFPEGVNLDPKEDVLSQIDEIVKANLSKTEKLPPGLYPFGQSYLTGFDAPLYIDVFPNGKGFCFELVRTGKRRVKKSGKSILQGYRRFKVFRIPEDQIEVSFTDLSNLGSPYTRAQLKLYDHFYFTPGLSPL